MKTLLAIGLIVTALPVAASAAPADGAASGEPRRDRRICRRVETASESRVPGRRLCLTAAQWRARSDADTDEAVAIIDSRSRNTENEGYTGGLGEGPGR